MYSFSLDLAFALPSALMAYGLVVGLSFLTNLSRLRWWAYALAFMPVWLAYGLAVYADPLPFEAGTGYRVLWVPLSLSVVTLAIVHGLRFGFVTDEPPSG